MPYESLELNPQIIEDIESVLYIFQTLSNMSLL